MGEPDQQAEARKPFPPSLPRRHAAPLRAPGDRKGVGGGYAGGACSLQGPCLRLHVVRIPQRKLQTRIKGVL